MRFYGKNRLEIGRSIAESTGAASRQAIRLLARWARGNPAAMEIVAGSRRRSSPARAPEGLSEADGIARGLSLSTEDLLAARALAESLAAFHCTNFGAVTPATSDGCVMLSWNFDASPALKALMGRFPLFVRETRGTIPYLCVGAPALFSIGIMNAEGLCCVVNAVGMTDDGEGLSPFELNNITMESSSIVGEAEAIFRAGPRQATKAMVFGLLMNWNTIWADAEQTLAVFEYSHNHFHRENAPKSGIIASANHHQFLDHSLSGGFDPSTQEMIAGSYSRLARMWALLDEHYGRIDPLTAKRIASDHFPDYSLLADYGIERQWWQEKLDDSTICAHAWNLGRHLKRIELEKALEEFTWSCTLYSLQMQPASATVWFTGGHPCRRDTLPLYWGRYLGSAAVRPTEAVEPGRVGRERVVRSRTGMFRRDMGAGESLLTRLWFDAVEAIEKPDLARVKM